jgi:hypothetical protein
MSTERPVVELEDRTGRSANNALKDFMSLALG